MSMLHSSACVAQNTVTAVIEKWYRALHFPSAYDEEFKAALTTISVSDSITTSAPCYETEDGKRNLLQALFLAEKTATLYRERGIPDAILMDTLSDLVIWTNTWSGIKNTLYLGELSWLKNHLCGKLFRLGRLQFCMGNAEHDIPEAGVKVGDPVMEVHIPEGAAMTREACEASIAEARSFFATYFPEFTYPCFTCHSWLLDPTLKAFLPAESNILAFQSRFTVTHMEENDAILRYVFAWDATRHDLDKFSCGSSLAKHVKERINAGEKFYAALGYFY